MGGGNVCVRNAFLTVLSPGIKRTEVEGEKGKVRRKSGICLQIAYVAQEGTCTIIVFFSQENEQEMCDYCCVPRGTGDYKVAMKIA